ncbi:MAG: hypothetical protein Q4E51_00450 [Lachnospiraceae bacterium]|nr:hypothetical protein [Lachnospiraceae bacterium]
MTTKQYTIKTIAYTVITLILLAVIVIVVDPFSHYHMPFGKFQAVETDERSALVGVAKNATYDTVLIGSSMSENFVDSWFNDGVFGNSTVKICLQGAHFSDYKLILDEVIKKPDVKNVVFSFDTYLLTNDPEEFPETIPEYLYNDKISDDSYYIWNKSVIFRYLPMFIINNIREGYSDDNAYVWSHKYGYDKYTARGAYISRRPISASYMKPYDTYFENSDVFIDSITPYIEARPDITFMLYSSPYSMLFWDNSVRLGNAEPEICALERVMNKLLDYDNVRIFYFQDEYDIVTDLNNYRDYSHFKQDINKYMYECMRDGKKEVTKDTYFDTLLHMYEYATSYDYEGLFH